MRIKCKQHGIQVGVNVSSDLLKAIEDEKFEASRWVTFAFADESLWEILLSENFCHKNNIFGTKVVLQSDDYPDWHNSISPACEKCVKEVFGS